MYSNRRGVIVEPTSNIQVSKNDLQEAFDDGRAKGSSFTISLSRKLNSGTAGERLGSAMGASIEFQDYRDYQPGDDIRRLDWSAYARSDKLTIRLYRDEIQPKADIISDTSSSMLSEPSKTLASLNLAGMLMEACFRSSISTAWWGFGSGFENIFRLSSRFPGCNMPSFRGGAGFASENPGLPHSISKKGIRFVISDFLWEAPAENVIRRFSRDASLLVLINILCEEELNPPLYGVSSLTDSESGGKLDLNIGENERRLYLAKLGKHIEMWKDGSVTHNCIFCQLNAENFLAGDFSPLIRSGILE